MTPPDAPDAEDQTANGFEIGDDINLTGPPEPIVDDGELKVKYLQAEERQDGEPEHRLQTVKLGTWQCLQCGTENYRGLVDGELADVGLCDGCEKEGPYTHVGLTEEEATVAERADTMWHPPTGISDKRIDELWPDIRQYLQDHWDASEPEIYEGLTAYALTTWFRENLTFVPHLMLMGTTTGGKTRLLNTLARVSYRAIVTASATPSSMFRLVDGYDVTYYISEYHGLEKDARRELDNVIRGGQKRGEVVTRSEQASAGYEPQVYDPFTHVAVATQYEPSDDIINRCVQIQSSPADRDMPPTHDEEAGEDIRNRLLFTRYLLLDSDRWERAEAEAYRFMEKKDIDGRTREKLLSVLTVAELWDRMELMVPFVERVVQQDKQAAAESQDAIVVEAIRDLALNEIGETQVLGDANPWAAVEIPLSQVAERYEDMTGVERSPSWVGQLRSRLGLESDRRRDGTVIKDESLGEKLQKLCADHNLDFEQLEPTEKVRELEQEDQYRGPCPGCGEQKKLTHENLVDGGNLCKVCAAEWKEAD